MNKNKSDKCPVCGTVENWSHVIRCPRLNEQNKKFMQNIKSELIKIENNENMR